MELTRPSANISATFTVSSNDWSIGVVAKVTAPIATFEPRSRLMLKCSDVPKETRHPTAGAPAANLQVILADMRSERTSDDCNPVVSGWKQQH